MLVFSATLPPQTPNHQRKSVKHKMMALGVGPLWGKDDSYCKS